MSKTTDGKRKLRRVCSYSRGSYPSFLSMIDVLSFIRGAA